MTVQPPAQVFGDDRGGDASARGRDEGDAAARAMNSLRRVVRCLHDASADTARALGVTSAQLFVLRELSKAEPLTISGLAEATATSQGSVSEVVTRLAARNLLTRRRSGADRRRVEIRLTASGRELLTRAGDTVQERLIIGFERLPVRAQHSLADCLDLWLAAAGLAGVEPSMFFEPAVAPLLANQATG